MSPTIVDFPFGNTIFVSPQVEGLMDSGSVVMFIKDTSPQEKARSIASWQGFIKSQIK